MTSDVEVFLISWAQVKNALFLAPNDERYIKALKDLEKRLEQDFSIDHMQLVARSYDTYTVSYHERGEAHLLTIDADEIEDFA